MRTAMTTNDENELLAAIGSTEPTTFNEFCRGYRACPRKGDTGGWRDVFEALGKLEREELVIIERENQRIEWMQLTETGAARVRARLDNGRGLLGLLA